MLLAGFFIPASIVVNMNGPSEMLLVHRGLSGSGLVGTLPRLCTEVP